ncbi:thioester reductase domain-containing protein [Massilia glaciei]|nr:thioester reductase domain-containing protein [Massilia glaciei]
MTAIFPNELTSLHGTQLLSDAQLSADIRPASKPELDIRRVFVTGATGFLGAQVLGELLRSTDWEIVCLVRADDDAHAQRRLGEAFTRARLSETETRAALMRVSAVRGNVAEADYGLGTSQFDALAARVDAVIHGAAEVSWIKPYRRLRGSHVNGTLNAIRLACHVRGKALYVVSTLAVCYAPDGPGTVDEFSDMAPYVTQMSLGYAQAKCVGESLLRAAAARGLAVGILRSGLVCGHSVSGESNQQDLISRAIRGSTQSLVAADIDWQIDCVPVDTAAQVLCTMARSGFAHGAPQGMARVLHLQHDSPRGWRELVLSLRLRGYPLQLVPLDQWLAQVEEMGKHDTSDLRVLRPFFLARPEGLGGRSQLELFLEPTRSRISSSTSQRWLTKHEIMIPRLDARLLNRYFADFVDTGFLPPSAAPCVSEPSAADLHAILVTALGVEVDEFTATPMGSDTGIMSELAAARSGGRTGLWHCQGALDGTGALNAVLKLKPNDAEQDALTLATAALCSPELARAFGQHLHRMPYRRSAARERAVGLMADVRIARHMPATLAVLPDCGDGVSGMLYGFLHDAQMAHDCTLGTHWSAAHLDAAVRGLGEIHSVWLGRERELLATGWIAGESCGYGLLAMQPLWRALADYAGPRLAAILGREVGAVQRAWIDDMQAWLPQTFAMPRSLIHHDFNPRNMAFRRDAQGLQLCAFDWELATVGLPQYDLAELLCHVLPEQGQGAFAHNAIEGHRAALEAASGRVLSPEEWRAGFALALRCFVICRLPMYVVIDRFRPQSSLPRVVRNAFWLTAWIG